MNLSGGTDEDKEGGTYRTYFRQVRDYDISNYSPGACGESVRPGQLALDLEVPIRDELAGHYDVVMTHTVLEHVFNVAAAFDNICRLSRDVVITVVPFLQAAHGVGYDDFWRFTASAIVRMHKERGLTVSYLSANENFGASVYIFTIGSKSPARWHRILSEMEGNLLSKAQTSYLGTRAILNSPVVYARRLTKSLLASRIWAFRARSGAKDDRDEPRAMRT